MDVEGLDKAMAWLRNATHNLEDAKRLVAEGKPAEAGFHAGAAYGQAAKAASDIWAWFTEALNVEAKQ